MDARLDPARVLGLGPGDAHVIRNAGGVVTDDTIRSLTISQRLLGTEEIVVIQHTDCGMLKIREDELESQIEAETGVPLPFVIDAISDLDGGVREVARAAAREPLPAEQGIGARFRLRRRYRRAARGACVELSRQPVVCTSSVLSSCAPSARLAS